MIDGRGEQRAAGRVVKVDRTVCVRTVCVVLEQSVGLLQCVHPPVPLFVKTNECKEIRRERTR
jgi:hypothetical protein